MNKLDKAIADFEDESSELNLGERISSLRKALMFSAFESLKKVNKHGKKSPVTEDDEYKQIECMKYFKEIEKMYSNEIKMNKLTGKSEDKMNSDFLKAIKEMKSSMGQIERRLDENLN